MEGPAGGSPHSVPHLPLAKDQWQAPPPSPSSSSSSLPPPPPQQHPQGAEERGVWLPAGPGHRVSPQAPARGDSLRRSGRSGLSAASAAPPKAPASNGTCSVLSGRSESVTSFEVSRRIPAPLGMSPLLIEALRRERITTATASPDAASTAVSSTLAPSLSIPIFPSATSTPASSPKESASSNAPTNKHGPTYTSFPRSTMRTGSFTRTLARMREVVDENVHIRRWGSWLFLGLNGLLVFLYLFFLVLVILSFTGTLVYGAAGLAAYPGLMVGELVVGFVTLGTATLGLLAYARHARPAFVLYALCMLACLVGHLVLGYLAFKRLHYGAWERGFLALWNGEMSAKNQLAVQHAFQCCGTYSPQLGGNLDSPTCFVGRRGGGMGGGTADLANSISGTGCYEPFTAFATAYLTATYTYAFCFILIALLAVALTILVARIIATRDAALRAKVLAA